MVFYLAEANLDEEIASLATFWETSKEFHCPSTAPSGLSSSLSHGDQTEVEQSGSSSGDVDGFAAVGFDVASIGVLDGVEDGHKAVSLGSSDGSQESIDLQYSGDSEGAMDSPVNSGHCPSVVASSGLVGGTVNDPNVVSRGVTDGMVDGFDTALCGALDDAGDEHGTLSSGADSAVLKSPPRHPSKATGEFKPSRDQKHFLPESQQTSSYLQDQPAPHCKHTCKWELG